MNTTASDCEDLVKILSWGRRIAPVALRQELQAAYGWNDRKARSVIARSWDEGYVNVSADRMVYAPDTVGPRTV